MKKIGKFLLVVIIFMLVLMVSCHKELKESLEDNENGTDTTSIVFGDYSVFAWNDLGMHCLNPDYDKLVILPPYNNVTVQVVKRGEKPEIVTNGITVSYRLIDNTYSYGKKKYGGFWDNSMKLFGVTLATNIGLRGFGLSGNMIVSGNHFIAEGIPVVPVDDNNIMNPYQVAEITVRNTAGTIIAKTKATVPTSDEINCSKCHGLTDPYGDILTRHDMKHQTNLMATKPILCASCHPSPALGMNTGPYAYLSLVMHRSHSDKPGVGCYDCHPGNMAACSRSLKHTAPDGNCITCHGTMSNVAGTIENGRIPWANEPFCVTCHTGVAGVSTGTNLYRNSQGHGQIFCSACHGSPHAMIPTSVSSDNYLSAQYQGLTSRVKSLGSCGVCHSSSRGDNGLNEFASEHGGSNPEKLIGCHACHTRVDLITSEWPHAFSWKNSN